MALTVGEKDQVWRGIHKHHSQDRTPENYAKVDLRTAIDDADTYAEANAVTMNTALNATFRSAATDAQKALVYAVVFIARYDPELAKRLLGVS